MIKLQKSTFYGETETKQALADFILSADILSMGAECQRFEWLFAGKQRRERAIFVSNGSAANLGLLQALLNLGRLKRGDRVGVSALTWATNVMPVIQLGLVPVAIDCALETLNVSPEAIAPYIGSLQALFLTNALGFCDNIDQIALLCSERGVLLIEDNCESLGSAAYGTRLGNFGLASTFSFFVGHHLSTIEGGMVCTNDAELAEMLVMTRAHGWDRNLSPAAQNRLREEHGVSRFHASYTFYDLALNIRPTEINGFLGVRQMQSWDEIVDLRQENFRVFHQAVSANPDLVPLRVSHMDIVSNFAMPVIARSVALCEEYRRRFQAAQIEVRPVIAGDITRQPFYRKHVRGRTECPNAGLIHEQGFYCPNNPELTAGELARISGILAGV